NNSTWYVLRYAEDFLAPAAAAGDPTAPFGVPSAPFLESTLQFDERRGVFELHAEPSAEAADPPRGIAVDVDGEVYCVDEHGVLVVVHCDGTRAPLPCEPNIVAQPAGLALDRRGFLYVADPAAHRVVVLDPRGGAVQAIIGGGGPIAPLDEPIDVAVAPSGFVY